MPNPMKNTKTQAKPGPLSTYDLLKTSWKYQLKEFCNNSNLHGVRYIAEKNRPFHEKFIWFSIIFIGLSISLIIISSLWDKFQTSPTITGLDTDFYMWDIPFPAITVCPSNPTDDKSVQDFITSLWGSDLDNDTYNYYHHFTTVVANLSFSNIAEVFAYEKNENLVNLNLKQAVVQVAIQCENVLDQCAFKGETFDCCEIFSPVFTDRGFCFTFNSKHFERNFSVSVSNNPDIDIGLIDKFETKYIYETDNDLSLDFTAVNIQENPLSVYIHSSVEKVATDLPPHHVWKGKVSKILFTPKETYTTEDARQLSITQRRCVFPDEISLITDDQYTFTACMTQCRMNMARNKCGCVPFFYGGIDGYKSCTIKDLACIARNKGEIEKGFNCNCELGCMNTVYEVQKMENSKDAISNTGLKVGFVSWPLIRYKRDVLFGWVDLFVAFGGIAGLFLGFSVLTAVETIYFFTLRAWCMVYRERDTLTQLHIEYENAQEPEINLDLKPYFDKVSSASSSKRETKEVDKSQPAGVDESLFHLPYLH